MMDRTVFDVPAPASGVDGVGASTTHHGLCRLSWRNWRLLAVISIITVSGLAAAMPPLLGRRIIAPWPWARTELVLLIGLTMTILVFVVYLSRQQLAVLALQRSLQRLQEQKNERTKRHYVRLFALLNVSRILRAERNLQGVYDCITKICMETFMGNRSSLMLIDKEGGEIVVQSASGEGRERITGRRQKLGEGIAGWAAKNRQPLFLSRHVDLSAYPGLDVEDTTALAAMVVPVFVSDELLGVLNVSTKEPDIVYDEEDLRALQVFAENAGCCIRHTELIEWMRATIAHLQSSLRERSAITPRRQSDSSERRR